MKKYGIDAMEELNKSLKSNANQNVYAIGIDAVGELTKLLLYYLDPINILKEERKKKLEQLNDKRK